MVQAEIIAIGDELTSGQRLDTNSQWLSQQLGYLGIPVIRHVTIGDQLPANINALQDAASRSQIVIISGGLGPTLDDLTREALGQAFGLPLELDTDSLLHIEQLFSRRGRPMPERNRVQALFPQGAVPIANPHGSAPGIDLTVSRSGNTCRFFALPGVPAEMKQMWDETVKQRIELMLGVDHGSLYFHSVKLFGMGESDVEACVPTLIARDRYPTVGITVSQATITLRIAARAKSAVEFQQVIAPTVNEIEENLGELIFGYGDDEMQHALLRALSNSQQSLAVLEIGAGSWVNESLLSSTGLALEERALETSGSKLDQSPDDRYWGGLVLPSFSTARQWLDGGPESHKEATEAGAWIQLAQKIRHQFGTSIGLVVGTYPSQSEISSSVAGTTFPFTFAIAAPDLLSDQVLLEKKDLGGHPEVLNSRVSKIAMDMLRKMLNASRR